jgi:hypothetical protein
MVPDMSPELRAMFQKVTKGMLSGKAGEKVTEDFKVNGEYVNTPEKGLVGHRRRREKATHHPDPEPELPAAVAAGGTCHEASGTSESNPISKGRCYLRRKYENEEVGSHRDESLCGFALLLRARLGTGHHVQLHAGHQLRPRSTPSNGYLFPAACTRIRSWTRKSKMPWCRS